MLNTIIFDAYGTLISTGTGSIDASREILALNCCDSVDPQAFYSQWKSLHKKHISELTTFVSEESIFRKDLNVLYKKYGFSRDSDADVKIMLTILGNRTAFPESREVIHFLQSKQYNVVIGSVTDTKPLLPDLDRNGITIPSVFTSETTGFYKPDIRFYQYILDSLGIKPSNALFVGDSLIDDVWGPQQLGIAACWVNRKGAERRDIAPTFSINNLNKLVQIINLIKE